MDNCPFLELSESTLLCALWMAGESLGHVEVTWVEARNTDGQSKQDETLQLKKKKNKQVGQKQFTFFLPQIAMFFKTYFCAAEFYF